ncbi:putative Oligosaccaryltransferase-domain-containing protein [Seiridium unicorne]|uniref:Dolichyl-diphosphooligosaccharide--protein glycosyltransferase subunit 4 n=1 Tax=Seiridium unicorne TaxID=138068 RepID=A0ABR2VCJ5_9PEZI
MHLPRRTELAPRLSHRYVLAATRHSGPPFQAPAGLKKVASQAAQSPPNINEAHHTCQSKRSNFTPEKRRSISYCQPTKSSRQLTMISDDDLYRLAIFLGSIAMVLIVLYHFFEVNSSDSALAEKASAAKPVQQAPAVGKSSSVAKS